MNVKNRTIFCHDNLYILRGLDTESVDLIYLDPPFNSKRNYSAPIGSEAAGAAFKDTWTLSDVDNAWHGEIAEREPALYQAIHASELTHGKGMKSYLIMLAVRLLVKPSTEEAIYSKKMSDAVALQLMSELELKILSDQVTDLSEDDRPDNLTKQLSLDIP